eukprot:gene19896-25851_t
MYGSSGCGKTTLALKLGYSMRDSHKFISISCADLVHKVVGESEKMISSIFTSARKIAPCFLLLDNIDSIISTDTSMNSPGNYRSSRTTHKAIDRIL